MGFSRQEYWSGLPCPPPEDLPDPGIEPGYSALQADSLPAELPRRPRHQEERPNMRLCGYHDSVITHLEADILEWEVKWALESITTNKASGGDGIPVELFQILKDDAMKVLHSIR